MIAKTALSSPAAAAVGMPRHGGLRAGQEHQNRLEASLVHLVNGLVAKEFTFITAEATAQQMQERLAKFDEGRLGMSGKVFGFMIGMSDMPNFTKVMTKHVVSFGAEKVDDEELAALQQLMRSHFPLCAVAFSRMYGPRFSAIVDGDGITQEKLFEMMDRFQEINLRMMQLGGRLSLKLFGKSIVGINTSCATGSMVLVTARTERARMLQQWISRKTLHSDTILAQMKERFTSVSFWAKAAFGFVEYKPHQLRQELIILDAESGQATSTATPRLGFEFGFLLSDITGA